MYSNPVNSLDNCSQPGPVKKNCSNLGQSRTSYSGGQKKDVCCYKKAGHYSRDCQLPKWKRKDQGSELTMKTVKRMAQEWIAQNNKKRKNTGPALTVDMVKRMAQEMIVEYNKKTKDFH